METTTMDGAATDNPTRVARSARQPAGNGGSRMDTEYHPAGALAAEVAGTAQKLMSQAAGQARAAATLVTGQANEVYARARLKADGVAQTVDPFVKQRPYAALGLAAAAGLVMGLLFAGRGPKVIYVKPRD